MRKRKADKLVLHKETVRTLGKDLSRVAAGAGSLACSMTCWSCSCQYETHSGGTDCCQ